MKLLIDENLSIRLVALLQEDYPGSAHVWPPPKVLWLSVGNVGTDAILALLKARVDAVERFAADPIQALLVIEPG